MSSIHQEEAENFWIATNKGTTEFNYFEMGFDKAIQIVGTCYECDYRYTEDCPLKDAISEVDLNTYYCASFDSKSVWK